MLSLVQAGKLLGVSPATLRHQVHNHRLKATLVGKTWVVDEAEVERYRLESLGQPGAPTKAETFPTIPGIRGARTKGR